MRISIIGLLFTFLSSFVYAGESIGNLAAFDSQVIDCLSKLTNTSRCTESVLAKYIVPGSEAQLAPVAGQLDDFMVKWLSDQTIFAVHPITTKKTGDLFQIKTYLIEDDMGNLMIFRYSVLKRLGKWYVFSFSINSNSDAVEGVLTGK